MILPKGKLVLRNLVLKSEQDQFEFGDTRNYRRESQRLGFPQLHGDSGRAGTFIPFEFSG